MADEALALLDLDGTVANYELSLMMGLEKIAAPGEHFPSVFRKDLPEHLKNRIKMIRNQKNWWFNLPKMERGFEILRVVREIGFKVMVLTNASKFRSEVWEQKVRWCKKNLPSDVDITITQNKGLIYGRVLIDDYTKYVSKWIKHRPRGLVIMPEHETNKDFKHQNVIHYNGRNIEDIRERLQIAFDRKEGE